MKNYVFLFLDFTYTMSLIHKQLTDFSLVYTKGELEMLYRKELLLLIEKNGFCSEYQAYSSVRDTGKNQVLLMADFLFGKTKTKENLFDTVPTELWPFMLSIESLKDFCKTCKTFYALRNTFTKTLMNSTIELFFDEKELIQMEKHLVDPWQMTTLIHSQSKFHLVGDVFPAVYAHKNYKNISDMLLSFGISGYSLFDSICSAFVYKRCPGGFFSMFLPFYPKITFYMPIDVYNKNYYKNLTTDISGPSTVKEFRELCCYEKSKLCNLFFAYAKYCLFHKKFSSLLELLRHNFPVLPQKWFFTSAIAKKEDIVYLETFMDTPCLVDFFMDVFLFPKRGPLDSTYDVQNFIYLVLDSKPQSYAFSKKEILTI